MSAISTASFPSGLFNDQPFYRPADVARALGISKDTITYHIRQRPSLFPEREGYTRWQEWTKDQLPQVVGSLLALCNQAKKNLAKLTEK